MFNSIYFALLDIHVAFKLLLASLPRNKSSKTKASFVTLAVPSPPDSSVLVLVRITIAAIIAANAMAAIPPTTNFFFKLQPGMD